MSRRRIHVALFVGSLGGGGAQRHVSLLAPRLDRSRFDAVVICRTRDGEYLPELEGAGIEVIEMASRGPLYGPDSFRAVYRLSRLLRERRIDVLHSFLFECNVQGILATRLTRKTRVVAGLRNMDDKYGPVRHLAYATVLRQADGIVAVCQNVKDRFVTRGLPEAIIQVIENGVEARVPRLDEDRSIAAAALGGSLPGPPLIVVLASLHPRKGLEHFLRAAAQLAPRFPDVRFLVGGEGPERPRLEALRRKLGLEGRVLMPGSVRPVRQLLSTADLFVLSSLEEGMSNALLEAQAEGVPAVVTDVGGNAEVVRNGETGLVVPPGSVDHLADAMATLLRDEVSRRAMGTAARARARDAFDLERMVSRIQTYYEQVLEDVARPVRS